MAAPLAASPMAAEAPALGPAPLLPAAPALAPISTIPPHACPQAAPNSAQATSIRFRSSTPERVPAKRSFIPPSQLRQALRRARAAAGSIVTCSLRARDFGSDRDR